MYSAIKNITDFFQKMEVAEHKQEIHCFQRYSTNVNEVFNILGPDEYLLVVSAVGYSKKGERIGALLSFHLDHTSRFLDLGKNSHEMYRKLLCLFTPEKAKPAPDSNMPTEPFKPFNPSEFFNNNVPDELSEKPSTRPIKELIHVENRGQLEESERTEFSHLVPHINDNAHVSAENLLKTLFFFGPEAAEACQLCNLSTAWIVPGTVYRKKKADFWSEFEKQKN